MKTLQSLFALCLVFFFSFSVTYAQHYTTLPHGNNGYGNLSANSTANWSYYIPSGTMAVFTLRNTANRSDMDLFIIDSYSRQLGEGDKAGSATDLVTIFGGSSGRTVYINIKNVGDENSSYRIYAHYIDFEDKLSDAIIDAGLNAALEGILCWLADADCDNNTSNSRDAGRAAGIVLDAIKGENFGGILKNTLIREVQTELRNELGYDFWGDFAVSYGVGIIDDIYRYY